MNDYGLTYRLTVCYPTFAALKFVAIPIFMKKKLSVFAFSEFLVSRCEKNTSNPRC